MRSDLSTILECCVCFSLRPPSDGTAAVYASPAAVDQSIRASVGNRNESSNMNKRNLWIKAWACDENELAGREMNLEWGWLAHGRGATVMAWRAVHRARERDKITCFHFHPLCSFVAWQASYRHQGHWRTIEDGCHVLINSDPMTPCGFFLISVGYSHII